MSGANQREQRSRASRPPPLGEIMSKVNIKEIIESPEFKEFVKLVAESTGRTSDSVTIGPGYILVDGHKYMVPQLSNHTDLRYHPI